jgi:predicted dehydrogenase/threonine dehydrogenase-like Zn-dependent dehydrogenase
MKQVLQHARSGALEVVEIPHSRARAGGVLVRNAASLISAGTERTAVDFAQKSLVNKARERPDLVRQVLDRVRQEGISQTVHAVLDRLDQYSVLGYSCAGVVEEVGRGAEEFAVGDRVACAGAAYAHHAEAVSVPRNLVVSIPEGVSFEDASYVTLGAIALHGVRTAESRLGEAVAVIGLGLLGQLTVQILRAAGCRVIGIDLEPDKVAFALQCGAETAVVRSADVPAAIASFTGGIGVDQVIVTAAANSNDPVELAAAICRDRGRVTIVGAVGMDLPRDPFYLKELELRLSRSYGPGRYDPSYEEKGNDYPVGYVRWTERRNMQEFLRLVASGAVSPSKLSTHAFPVEQAAEAYRIITGERAEPFLGIVLTYPNSQQPIVDTVTLNGTGKKRNTEQLGIGFIGAGSFGKTVLLPRFARLKGARLTGIATATGASARATGQRYQFEFCTTEPERLIGDPGTEAVVITTRHGSHARLTAMALRAGKSVFVEKPIALNEEDLLDVISAQQESGKVLCVGFNRRFSPLAVEMKEALPGVGQIAIQYRINAGAIPLDHWIHDPDQGGGRMIGEACHFIDFCQFLTDEAPVEVFAQSIGGVGAETHDTVTINIRFARGSIASINYFANGHRSIPKEYIEVYGGGVIAILDDFRSLSILNGGKRQDRKVRAQQKGFDEEVEAFARAIEEQLLPISMASLAGTTRASFAIEEALRTGQPVRLREHL